MKRVIVLCMLLSLFLSGCGLSKTEAQGLFLSDTVVNIPLNPEEETVPAEESIPEETSPEITAEATETIPEETKAPVSSSKATGGSKSSGSKTSSSAKPSAPKATEPPATEAPETEPPVAEPVQTEATEPPVFDISGYSPGSFEYAVAEQINACRADAGLDPVSVNVTLCGIASLRAWEISQSWSHTRPNGNGWKSVLSDYGFGYGCAAEELANTVGYNSDAVVSKWMCAESNSADILNPDFTTIGVGIYSADGVIYLAAILAG